MYIPYYYNLKLSKCVKVSDEPVWVLSGHHMARNNQTVLQT